MRKYWHRGLLFFVFFASGLSGCGKGETPAPEAEIDDNIRLGETPIVLSGWLDLSREELAAKVKATLDTALAQRSDIQTKGAELLPNLRPPIVAPVLRETVFSAKTKISRPIYLKDGAFDADLALHLARYGDHEAALVYADPADKALRQQIDACQTERNYPVEWTQLVGLQLHLAELKLANGDLDGPAELVALHRQLIGLLDKKAAAGPLGAALLPIGRRALAEAIPAWRAADQKKPMLADDVDAALKEWGEVPTPTPPVRPGAGRDAVARLMGVENDGRTLVAATPEAVCRSLDLLDLPVLQEGVQNVLAFLSEDGKLAELLFTYKDGTVDKFPDPVNFGHHFVDLGFTASEVKKDNRLGRQTFTGAGLAYDVTTVPGSAAINGLVRVRLEKAAPASFVNRDLRDFGPLNLNRTFEENRVMLAPELAPAKVLHITRKEALERVDQPVSQVKLAEIDVEQLEGFDIIASLQIHWQNEAALNLISGTKMAVPLWKAFGPARVESMDGTNHGFLAFIWENDTTTITFCVPYDDKVAPEMVVRDRRGAAAAKEREIAAKQFDSKERAARWKDGKPLTRINRGLPLADLGSLQLGQPKSEAHKILEAVPDKRLTPLPDGGFNLLFLSQPPAGVTFWPRELFVRFDESEQVAEIRARYQDGITLPAKTRPALLDLLKKTAGAPLKAEPTWLGVWTDLPRTAAPICYRWRDDTTVLTFQRDAYTTEVTVRDCPLDAPHGVELPPLAFCYRGIAGCQLGDRRSEIMTRWKINQPTLTNDNALVLAPADGPYDALLVYFSDGPDGIVNRIVAQHRAKPTDSAATREILDAWGADVDHLGTIRRRDNPAPPLLSAMSFHDDQTRVRIFGQQTVTGPRLYTEWRDLPIPVPAKTAKK